MVTVRQGFSAVTKAFKMTNDRWTTVILSAVILKYVSNMMKTKDKYHKMRKLCDSTKFPYQEFRWNYGILPSECM